MKKCNNCNKYVSDLETKCPNCNMELEEVKSNIDFGNIDNTSYNDNFDIKVFIKEPKNRKKIFMIGGISVGAFIFLILLFIVIFGGKSNSSYLRFTKVIDQVEEYLSDNYLDNNAIETGKYNLVYKINDKRREYNGEYGRDTKNRILSITGTMNDPNEHTGGVILDAREFNFELYLKNNILNINSQEIFENNISIPLNDDSGLLITKNYSLSSLLSGFFDAIRSTLKTTHYNNDKKTINYRGEEINTNYQYILLDNKGKTKFYQTLYQNLIDESNFVNEYSRIKNISTESVTEKLNNLITTSEYKYSGESDKYTTLGVYYNGNKIYRIELDRINDDENDKLYLDIGDTKYYLYYFQGDKNIYEATLAETTKEIAGVINQTIAITYISDNYDIDFNLKLMKNNNSVLKKKEFENSKSSRDLTEEDINALRFNVSLYTNFDIVGNLLTASKNRCTKELNCHCEENAELCSCVYEDDFIQCPIEDVKDI